MAQNKQIEAALDELKELDQLFDDPISALYAASKHDPNAVAHRHLYIFYRERLWRTKDILIKQSRLA